MKALKGTLFIAIFVLVSFASNAQQIDDVKKVWAYLESNGTMKQYSNAYVELLNLMEKQYPKSDRNGNGWLYLEKNKTKALNEIKDMLTAIYMQHFDMKEIDQMHSFYSSEAGKQMVEKNSGLSDDQKAAVDNFFNSALGKKLKEKQGVLSEEISGVSEYWSKDLYQTASLLLKE